MAHRCIFGRVGSCMPMCGHSLKIFSLAVDLQQGEVLSQGPQPGAGAAAMRSAVAQHTCSCRPRRKELWVVDNPCSCNCSTHRSAAQ